MPKRKGNEAVFRIEVVSRRLNKVVIGRGYAGRETDQVSKQASLDKMVRERKRESSA